MAAVGDALLVNRENMDEDSYDLVLKLMLEDSRQLADGKGKQKEGGTISDAQVAFGLYANEIQNALTMDADHRLHVSIQRALRTDAHAVLQLLHEERRAQHDYEVAVALSEGRDPPPLPQPPPTPEAVPEIASVYGPGARQAVKGKGKEIGTVRPAKRPGTEDLNLRDVIDEDSIIQGKRARHGETSSWAASRQPPASHRTCTSCMESMPESRLIHAPCSHEYCHECITSLFTSAMRDETLFPPKCCQQAIPAEHHSRILGRNLVDLYHAKEVEFSTENRTYCHSADCGAFIKPGDVGRCSSCDMRTCVSCKMVAHDGDCPEDVELHRVLEMAEQAGWRRCTKCNAMIELAHGCNHIT